MSPRRAGIVPPCTLAPLRSLASTHLVTGRGSRWATLVLGGRSPRRGGVCHAEVDCQGRRVHVGFPAQGGFYSGPSLRCVGGRAIVAGRRASCLARTSRARSESTWPTHPAARSRLRRPVLGTGPGRRARRLGLGPRRWRSWEDAPRAWHGPVGLSRARSESTWPTHPAARSRLRRPVLGISLSLA